MPKISIVIITKNESLNIIDCIHSAKKVSDDIIIVDSGSTDATVLLAQREHVQVESITWKGYGNARNAGAMLAANDWILSLDADERITAELATTISNLSLQDSRIVYGFKRQNYFGRISVQYGELAHDKVFRLYNRHYVKWNLVPVHEKLVGEGIVYKTLDNVVTHFGIRSGEHYRNKKEIYASLCALKYQQEKRRFGGTLVYLSPVFSFMKAYLFQLGFLDKKIGLTIAKINATYTRKKYQHLKDLNEQEKRPAEYNLVTHS